MVSDQTLMRIENGQPGLGLRFVLEEGEGDISIKF
jgi:hypothetical protein